MLYIELLFVFMFLFFCHREMIPKNKTIFGKQMFLNIT